MSTVQFPYLSGTRTQLATVESLNSTVTPRNSTGKKNIQQHSDMNSTIKLEYSPVTPRNQQEKKGNSTVLGHEFNSKIGIFTSVPREFNNRLRVFNSNPINSTENTRRSFDRLRKE